MSLDKLLLELLETQKRIAAALEALVEAQGIVPDALSAIGPAAEESAEEEEEELEDDLEEEDLEDDLEEDLEEEDLEDDLEEEEPEPAARKKKSKKKAAKKKPVAKKTMKKKSQIGKTNKAGKSQYTADEVRAKLKDLQIATGKKAEVMSILKKHGASTFPQLKVGKYDQVVADVDKKLE